IAVGRREAGLGLATHRDTKTARLLDGDDHDSIDFSISKNPLREFFSRPDTGREALERFDNDVLVGPRLLVDLLDDPTALGERRFREKSAVVFNRRRSSKQRRCEEDGSQRRKRGDSSALLRFVHEDPSERYCSFFLP